MKSIIALWGLTALSLIAIMNCISTWRKTMKSNKRNRAKLVKDLTNSILGTAVVVVTTVLSWVL